MVIEPANESMAMVPSMTKYGRRSSMASAFATGYVNLTTFWGEF
jgi:hypothetical protein